MEFIDIFGIVIALIALGVSVWGIRDVRKQVRFLIELERNRTFTRLLNEYILRFLEADERLNWATMHEFCMLQHALDPKRTKESSQAAAMNEVLQLAQQLVNEGKAKWKPDMDVEKARKAVQEWENDKNKVRLSVILGKSSESLL